MVEKPHYTAHRKRLRERFLKTGAEGMQDYELLELLLGYAIPRRDVKPLAKELRKHFGSISAVLDAGEDELRRIPGLGSYAAGLIRLVKEFCCYQLAEEIHGREALGSSREVVDFARIKLAGCSCEAFMAIYLDNRNQVLAHQIIAEGTVDHAVIYPRRIIEEALKHKASGLILIHNHPSGQTTPSRDDLLLTERLSQAAGLIDLRIIDHLIVGQQGYYSFAEEKLLSPPG